VDSWEPADIQTDITERKLNEEVQKQRVIEAEQRRVEAEEAKHQQELLIDITSCVITRQVKDVADQQSRDPKPHLQFDADKFSDSS
jgi:hypothetical protein